MSKIERPSRDIVELFGHAPDDLTKTARSLWDIGACPFTNSPCSKTNSDNTVVYGTCTVTSKGEPCIICPNRLYENNLIVLQRISEEAFGVAPEFIKYENYISRRTEKGPFVVPLGHKSGKEVSVSNMSMDWVLALVTNSKLIKYVGIEVQSIDITGNYRDNFYAYKNLEKGHGKVRIPSSGHGLNWANVHKRLMPQLIRKGLIYSRSEMVKKGLYFIVPDIVYRRFEEVIGKDIKTDCDDSPETMTVHTYGLSDAPGPGKMRTLCPIRQHKISLEEFSKRFINGPNLPAAIDLDNAVRSSLGCK